MKSFFRAVYNKIHISSLRSYTTYMFTGITALALTISGIFFYAQTAHTLQESYKEQMFQQLDNTMNQISEQISQIDSLYALFISNNLIYDSLESASTGSYNTTAVERQMAYLLVTNYVWKEQFIDSISIYTNRENTYHVSVLNSSIQNTYIRKLYQNIDKKYPFLQIRPSSDGSNTLYFVRNIFSSSTGQPSATMLISINSQKWMDFLSDNLDSNWSILLYNDEFKLSSNPVHSITSNMDDYLMVSEKLDNLNLFTVVVAPKQELQQKLNMALRTYLIVIFAVILAALSVTYILSKAVTRPVMRMIEYVNRIGEGHYEESIPPMEMYEEFNSLALAFNHMLKEINAYHTDNLDKQLLLKNAEIQALQSQINPHFLFNILNTLAWKAQMSDNPELYQMSISLGELLKTNILSKSSSYIPLEEEIKYIKFYVYLQKMRFEDKINVSFEIASGLQNLPIPCFCLQSLVENSFEHGLEPKKGNGELIISIQYHVSYIHFSVRDNGIGFQNIPDLGSISASPGGNHTHVGLRNLNRRLFLLYGETSELQISSIPDVETIVSFNIPFTEEKAL